MTIEKDGLVADGVNVLQILKLQAKKGDALNITIEGEDEEEALKALVTAIENGLGE